MNTTGTTTTGGWHGNHVPLPITARPLPQRGRRTGLDWAAHTTGPDPDAIARLARLGIVTVTEETVEDKPVRVVRKVKPKKPRYRPPQAEFDIEAAAKDYQAGATLREIADRLGLSTEPVRARLVDHGVTMRPHTARFGVPIERLFELRRQGLTIKAIGEEVGVTGDQIRKRLRAAGYDGPTPPSGNQPTAPHVVEAVLADYATGLTVAQIATARGVSESTVKRYARGVCK